MPASELTSDTGKRVVRGSLSVAEDLYTQTDLCCSPHYAKSPAAITRHWTESDVNLLNELLIDRKGVYDGQSQQTRRVASIGPGRHRLIHIAHWLTLPNLIKTHFATINIKIIYEEMNKYKLDLLLN